jgi:hypothetical protein
MPAMHAGEACRHLVGGLVGLVEFLGADKGEHGIGRDVQLNVPYLPDLIRCRGQPA